MSDRNLRLQVILSAVDKLTRPFKGAQAANKRLAETIKQSRQQLRELNQQASKIEGFRKTKRQLAETQQAYRSATERVAALSRALNTSANPTQTQIRQLQQAKNAAAQLKNKTNALNQSLQRQRDTLHASGIATNQLGQAQRRLNADISRANNTLAQQRQQLERLEQREKKMATAKSSYQKGQHLRREMLGHGASITASGVGILMGVKPMLNEAAIYDKEMSSFRALGVGENILKDADKFANGMHIIGNSASDNLKTLKEAHSVLRHYDEAKMVTPELLRMRYATEFLTMHGLSDEKAKEFRDQSQEVLKIAELRNMINSPEDFKRSVNMSTQAMAASGGMVLPSDYMAMMKTGEMAAKQMSDEAFYFSMSHIIQQIGGDRTGTGLSSAYSALMMGYMKLSAAEELNKIGLLKPDALRYSKTGKLARVEKNALVNSRKFQTDPFRYLIDEIVPRIKKKYPGLDETGIETNIAQLFSNKKAAGLFVTMYRERANMEKQIKAGHEAYRVDQLVKEGSSTAQGQELELGSRKRDLYKQIGNHLLPLYVKGLEKLSAMLTRVKRFFSDHSTVTKYLSVSIALLGMILAIMGAITLALATLLGPLVVVRLGFALLGIKGAGSLKLLSGAFSVIGKVLMWLGRLMLAHPILLIISLIALGAYLIWKNWDKLGPWFKRLWEGIKNAFFAAWEFIKNYILNWTLFGLIYRHWDKIVAYTSTTWANIKTKIAKKWDEIIEDTGKLPERFKRFGTEIIDKLVTGIKEKWAALKQSLSELGTQIKEAVTPDFMKEQAQKPTVKQALDAYNSATRPHANPFTAFTGAHDTGGYIPAGKFGLVGEYGPELINGPARVTSRRQTAMLARMAAAALSMGASTVSAQPVPLHPYSLPAAQYQNAGVTVINPHQRNDRPAYEIHIHTTPAQSAQDIAQAVARELDRREQQQRARARSAFADREEY
ncbi:phage tail tape measure protein [Xenorhabdus taiwanensis]|uniref:Phage tail tape measure protein n=1 Tax=Xenorhabdus taiwanensis TaxID=3085177 RepID=A0ABN7C251_9GAMM|nr:phage tail tape measure protein [Xenorhabdus sp. TCT-1]